MKIKNYMVMGMILLVVLMVGCQERSTDTKPDTGVTVTIDHEVASDDTAIMKADEKTVDMKDEGMTGDTEDSTPAPVVESEPTVKEFTMTAKNWEFIPNTIEVNKGDNVKLIVKSIDVTHGISLSEYGINVRLSPNREEVVEFVADKAGEFSFRCSVSCGAGHRGMTGTIKVNE